MRKPLAVIAAVTLVAAACSSAGAAVVASVGDVEITEADVGALFESETLPIDESLRQTIFALAAREVLTQGLKADFGAEVDQAEVESVYADLIARMEASGATAAEFLGIDDAGPAMVHFNAEIGEIRQTAIDGLLAAEGALDDFFSDPLQYTTVCVRHILVGTADEADVVKQRLETGDDFATVAAEVSIDTATPGGDLGCSVAGRYVPEFADATLEAEPGRLYGPVETQFGFHVLIVDDRSAPTPDELRADPQNYLTDDELASVWQGWFNDKLQEAEVDVDAKYGTWSPVGIVPPDGE